MHHRFNRHELRQTLGDGEGEKGLECYSPWGHKQLDTTWQLNNNNNRCISKLHAYICDIKSFLLSLEDLLT